MSISLAAAANSRLLADLKIRSRSLLFHQIFSFLYERDSYNHASQTTKINRRPRSTLTAIKLHLGEQRGGFGFLRATKKRAFYGRSTKNLFNYARALQERTT